MVRQRAFSIAMIAIASTSAPVFGQLHLPSTVTTPVDWTWAYEGNALPDSSSSPIEFPPGSPHFDTPQVEMSNFTVSEDPLTHAFIVSFPRIDWGKPQSEWVNMTIPVSVPVPEPGGVAGALALALVGAGFLSRRRCGG